MDQDKLIEESAIKISIQKIALKINDKMQQYKKTKDKKIESELVELLKDRDLAYSNDKETIKKYLKSRSE